MGVRLRLGRRGVICGAIVCAVLFGLVGQGAHRAGARVLDNGLISISGSPDVNEGSPATFTATIDVPAATDANVTYSASAGAVGGSFTIPAGESSVDFQVTTTGDGVYQSSPRTFTVTLTGTDLLDGSMIDSSADTATGTLENVDPAPPPPSVVSIGDATAPVTEGSAASFPVSVSPAAGVAFNVSYTSSGGGVSGSFHVSQGATSLQVPVATASNSTPQDDRDFTVTLTTTDASNGSSVDGTAASGTIIDNDWTVTLSPINPGAVSEVGGSIQFNAALNAPAPAHHALAVDYAVTDGSAIRGTNYTVGSASGTLAFTSGSSTASVTVNARDDGIYLAGATKTFTIALSSPQGATIAGPSSSTGTIADADTAPQMGISNCPGGSVNGGSSAVFPIRVQAASVPATVTYTTSAGTTVPGDFDAGSGTVTVPPGSSLRQVNLQIPTHAIAPSGSRSFSVQLSSPQGARLVASSGSCTIVSSGTGSSTRPSVQLATPAPVAEPATGSTSAIVTVKLVAPPAQTTPTAVHVHWQTADGTATTPADYTGANGDLTWAAGVYSSQTFSVQVNSNAALTAPATFTVAFTSPDGSAGFVSSQSVTVTVLPVGSTASVLSIADASAASHAGSVSVPVTMTPAGSAAVTVDYATANGTGSKGAVAGTDYTAKSGTLTFAPGETQKTISIPIVAFTGVQQSKSFQVILSNPKGATIATGTATVTILNDNVPITLPPVTTTSTLPPPQKTPVPVPVPRSNTDHPVLVQMLTGESRANAKGLATYKVSCPDVVIQQCAGTVTFDVRVQVNSGSKKKPKLKTLRVGNGSFSIYSGASGSVVMKLTRPGLKLLLAAKRLRVKATIHAKDGAGVKGVTAWLVSVTAPAPTKKKAAAKKP